jgi:4-hydroxy-3-polyprenylbenzoate decarboxylase
MRSSASHLSNRAAVETRSRSFCTVTHVATASRLVQQPCTRPSTSTRTQGASKIASTRHHSLLFCPDQDSPISRPKRIVVAVTGATGAPYAIRLLEILRDLGIETHLVMSKWALATLKYETDLTEQQIRGLANINYTVKDMSAPPSSGSFQHDGMIIVPCSMKTLAAVRIGYCEDLISRSADVTLKEGRRLVMVVRETPLSDIHLENMLFLRRAGATIFPPVPAFYTKPQDLGDMVDQSVGRMLDCLGIHTDFFKRWNGFERSEPVARVAYVG